MAVKFKNTCVLRMLRTIERIFGDLCGSLFHHIRKYIIIDYTLQLYYAIINVKSPDDLRVG